MKIFVTGATGFVGKHLIKRLLKEGHKVKALVRDIKKAEDFKGVEIIIGDLFSEDKIKDAVKDVDIIIHLAAMIHAINATEDDYRKINVEGTKNIIEACKENKELKRLIYFSSVTVYGNVKNAEKVIIDENYPCDKQNEYGKTKYEGEKVIESYNIPYTIIRPGRIYGPGDMTMIPLFKIIKKGLFVQVGGGKSLMMPIYIDDLIDFVILCIKKPISKNQVYIAVGEENILKKKFMEMIAKELNIKLRNLSVPIYLAYPVAALMEIPFRIINKEPIVSRKQLRFFIESRRYSINKAKKELGFSPKVNLEKGVKETINWCKKERLV